MPVRKNIRNINWLMLAKVVGWLLMIESAFMALPGIVSFAWGESDGWVFATFSLLTFFIGYVLNHFLHPARRVMAKREGFLLTALVWIVFSLFGMLPFLLCAHPVGLIDAFFESMSGFTTTGVSVFPDPEALSHGVSLWRAMMQWIGGLGIIIFTLAVLPMLNSAGGMQMFNAEATGITHDKIQPRISQTAKAFWIIYASLTIVCALLLWMGPMSLFDAVCHALGTVSTGGYSTSVSGPAAWGSAYVDTVITIFMFIGGTSFTLLFMVLTGRVAAVKSNATFRFYAFAVIIATAIFAAVTAIEKGSASTLRSLLIEPIFQIVSTITSTGYSVPGVSGWAPVLLALLLPMMLSGACAGSTSGGAKLDRLLVLGRYVRNSLKRVLQPNSITKVEIDGRVLTSDTVNHVVSFLAIYAIIIIFTACALTAMGAGLSDGFLCAAACVSNAGLTPDVFGGSLSISSLPAVGKIVLSFVMLIGRLEVFTILVLFLPGFWRR